MSDTRLAPNGMVCSIDHLASSAGVTAMQRGGSAADAAVAASAVVAVTSPHLCGMGGDLFALVHDGGGDGVPAALNASGRAGSGVDAAALRAEGHKEMPFTGDIRSVPVPGCVDGWLALHDRFGRLPLGEVLAPAQSYAEDGFPASPLLAAVVPMLEGVHGAADLFPSGAAVGRGHRVRRPGVARALDGITTRGRAGFYQGDFGVGLLALGDGVYAGADLVAAQADWVDPLRVTAWDHHLWTIPPNSQGYLILLAAAVADGLTLPDEPDDPSWAHLLVEAARLASYDRLAVLHDRADVGPLLAADEVGRRRSLIDVNRRSPLPSPVADGGTMYLCAVDGEGMGVSLIQSNAAGFGSQLFEPSTGINLQNRGIGFSLEPGHPAELGPGRRPPHTLSPALVTRADGSLRAVLGTMGGDSQPQIVLQLLARLLRHGQSPGRAISAPRWVLAARQSTGFNTWAAPDEVVVQLEASAPDAWESGLRTRGHEVRVVDQAHTFGHAHLIERRDDGMLAGAADPRAQISAAAAY